MDTAYQILAFVQAAWPTVAMIVVVALGIGLSLRTERGREALVKLAWVLIGAGKRAVRRVRGLHG
jgi:hypothetical protein